MNFLVQIGLIKLIHPKQECDINDFRVDNSKYFIEYLKKNKKRVMLTMLD